MPETTQQLKSDIDHGKTGDKIDQGFDPGLATLGTDDEAAGTPATPAELRLARELEVGDAAAQPAGQGARDGKPGLPVVWIIGGALVLVLLAILLAVGW